MANLRFHKRGTHFKGPLLGDNRAAGGMLKNMPIELMGLREDFIKFNDFLLLGDFTVGATDWVQANIGTPTGNVQTASRATISALGISLSTARGTVFTYAGTSNNGGAGAGTQVQFRGTSAPGGLGHDWSDVDLDNNYVAWGARFYVVNGTTGAAVGQPGLGSVLIGFASAGTVFTAASLLSNAITGYWFRIDANNKLFAETSRGGTTGNAATISVSARDVVGRTGYPVTTGSPLVSASTFATGYWVEVGMRIRTDDVTSATAVQSIDCFVNGNRVTTLKDAVNGAVPNVITYPTIAVTNSTTQTGNSIILDYFWTCIDRAQPTFTAPAY